MLPVIQIGPLAVQTAGLVLVLGLWLAVELAGREAKRMDLGSGVIQNAGLYAILSGIVAARLAHVVQHWPIYRENLLGIVSLNPQTLTPVAGFVVGLLVAVVYLQRKEIPARPLFDAIAPGAAVFVAALALANLANGTAFGVETRVPWAIEMWEARRHPVQVYELIAALAILAIVLRIGRWAPAPGLSFLLFIALYSGMRLLLEPLRATGEILPGGFRAAQVVGLAAMLVALGLMPVWSRRPREADSEPVMVEEVQS